MPTETYFRLVVEGPPDAVARFRADDQWWTVEPWSGLYKPRVDEATNGRYVCTYADDYKRPGPDIAAMAAAHPELKLTVEHCDEFGTIAGRARYAGGDKQITERVDPGTLAWMNWTEDGEEDPDA